ncbi:MULTISPECIES: SymE family type I addiction module toxin [Brenneria]|uniref:Type I toxin-antitoxin system SymE family toxin n=1 Tax=Brenneria nigrifluens DSM 30175 = ATCC 13028 TaxID=1121120 RepID=A0A2U1UEL1_9GAMM|nr:type I toxin-antitoxin system SymE family toxin [Brenneria nigrifluens DSM 30175 = ATCC 13028]PWC20108.1 type I toxin-antitoxin system SymE family toxin [Brenneria nigrifluens DSM 30175 = ATCC 13028]QCR06899.1 type I toxin-antitoxin system SymE family toxin [Brenneria nigrifluens DSM 30175 = ATCC 13028]
MSATNARTPLQHLYLFRCSHPTTKPPCPQLKLSGRWLEELGFNTGQPVIVTVERGKLVIETELRV